jgi:hypothetical protein
MADSQSKTTMPAKNPRRVSHAEAGREVQPDAPEKARRPEIGGPEGPEPTRYGDWERNGRCTDF